MWLSNAFAKNNVLSLLLGISVLLNAVAVADTAHFYDGRVVRGKLYRVTGDLIEFKYGLWRIQNIQRVSLSNRHDLIEMKNGQKYFGEILYSDVFQVEIITATGRTKLSRLGIKNVVLGTPQQPPVDIPKASMPDTNTQTVYGPNGNSQVRIPVQADNAKPTLLFPPSNVPSEDRDSINTDDRLP